MPVHELVGGARVVGEDDAFLDEVDFEVELVEDHPVLEVAVEAVRLFDEDGPAGVAVLFEPREHLREAGAAGALGGLHVDELADDREPPVVGVAVEHPLLGGDGEAFALLLLRRHARRRRRGGKAAAAASRAAPRGVRLARRRGMRTAPWATDRRHLEVTPAGLGGPFVGLPDRLRINQP